MAVDVAVMQQPALIQVGHDLGVGVLDELAREGIVPCDDALQVHGLHEVQALLPSQPQVLVAEGRRNVDDARPVLHGHEVGGDHPGSEVTLPVRRRQDARLEPADPGAEIGGSIQRRVAQPHQIAARQRGDYGEFLPDVVLHQGGGESDALLAFVVFNLHDGIFGIGVNSEGGVARQCPRRSCPCQQVCGRIAGVEGRRDCRPIGRGIDAELDEHRRVRRVLLVAEGQLVGAEAGDAAGAVGSAPHALVQQATVPQGFEYPPPRLDVVVFEGDIRVVHVHPEADPVGHFLPLADVAEDALAALLVELLDAVFLDVALAGEAQLLLYAELDWQAVGIPAALAEHLVALHRLVAAHHVLEDAGQDVVNAGAAVGSGRPVVEHEARRALPLRAGAAEHIAFLPVLQDTGVQFGKADSAGNGTEHLQRPPGQGFGTSLCPQVSTEGGPPTIITQWDK